MLTDDDTNRPYWSVSRRHEYYNKLGYVPTYLPPEPTYVCTVRVAMRSSCQNE
jgi:hypothetical protein